MNLIKPTPSVPWATITAQLTVVSTTSSIPSNGTSVFSLTVFPPCNSSKRMQPLETNISVLTIGYITSSKDTKWKAKQVTYQKDKKRFSQESKDRKQVNISFPPILKCKWLGYCWVFFNEHHVTWFSRMRMFVRGTGSSYSGCWPLSVTPQVGVLEYQRGNPDKLKKEHLLKGASAKRDTDREVKKWTRRISLSKVHEAHPESDCQKTASAPVILKE